MVPHESFGHDQAQHGVAEKLEPFVAGIAVARLVRQRRVRECLLQELGSREGVTDARRDRGQVGRVAGLRLGQ
jgi:hypothetical protein